ncbi:MAG: hypothetical protein CMC96_00035 [Flavobacteriales bacterium]|nr:hypothetical protein [Flavobacteriales bacterium]
MSVYLPKLVSEQLNCLVYSILSLLFSIDEKSKQKNLGLFPNLSLPLLNGDDFSDLQRFTLELLQSLAPFSSLQT